MNLTILTLALGALVIGGGCTASSVGGSASAGPPTAVPSSAPQVSVAPNVQGEVGYAGLAIDTTLQSISRSNPTKEAKAAMDQCWGLDDSHVVGAALVPEASDAAKYAPFVATQSELKSDAPVWIVQYEGDWNFRGHVSHDPTCMVVDGVGFFFVTHGGVGSDGQVTEPFAAPISPTLALPPLAP